MTQSGSARLHRFSIPALLAVVLAVATVLVLISATPAAAQDGGQAADANQAPTLHLDGYNPYQTRREGGSAVSYSPFVVEGDVMEIRAHASEPDCEQVSFAWEQTNSPPDTSAGNLTQQDHINIAEPDGSRRCWAKSTLRFTAPRVDANASLTFRVTATDSQGNVGHADITVEVLNSDGPGNTAPTTSINGGETAPIPAGQTMYLRGSGHDVETDPLSLTHQRTQIGGADVEIQRTDTTSASFVAPDATGTLEFRLTVTDLYNPRLSDAYTVAVTVSGATSGASREEPPVESDPEEELTPVTDCLASLGELTAAADYAGTWDDGECKAHHQDSLGRYFQFTLSEETEVSVSLSAGELFVSSRTPQNGWALSPKRPTKTVFAAAATTASWSTTAATATR